MAVGYCGNDYCNPQKEDIDATCHDLGKEAGKWIMYRPDPARPKYQCYCICSCIGDHTPITIPGGSTVLIENVVAGSTQILAAGRDLKFTPYVAGQKSAAPKTLTSNTVYVQYTAGGQQQTLAVTQSHPFFLFETKEVCAAANLKLSDHLIDANGQAVAINAIHPGDYDGAFWEISTSLEAPDGNYTGHLILTGGVVSGDFAIETFVNYPIGDPSPALQAHMARPIVGSRQWRLENVAMGAAAAVPTGPLDVRGAKFTPAILKRVEIPEHASDFLPTMQAALLERDVVPKKPYNDGYSLDMCQWLLDTVFRPMHPDINFLFDWYSDECNCWSWITDKKKYVLLSGGLARIEDFDYDGVSLALAHEIGHLYGKSDGSPSGLTCEGEADFYASSVVMRLLWFGTRYFDFTQSAIDQVKLLYKYIELPDRDGDTKQPASARVLLKDKLGRPYPTNECRIATWEAGMASPKKPECAACAPV